MNTRIFDLQHQIDRQNAVLDDDTQRGRHRAAELQLEKLERHLAAAEKDERAYIQREAEIQERRAESECKARRELEEQLMDAYISAAPGTTRREARRALPRLLDEHRRKQMADAERRSRPAAYRV